jgi:hypothetical protein
MSSSQQPTLGQDEVAHLRSQNDQLWKIIEKQRVMIQNLQKDNVRLSAERDGLQDQLNIMEKELSRKQRVASLLISPQTLREIAEQDDVASTPSSENTPSPIEAFTTASLASPMPPPRSPYRALRDKTEDYNSLDSIVVHKKTLDGEPESLVPELNTINGRSSPGSPAPGPHTKYRKDSAPLPSSPIVPTPSKSSSSLEVRNKRQSIHLPPPIPVDERAASPTTTLNTQSNNNTLKYDDDEQPQPQQAGFMGNMSNVCVKVVGSTIKPNEKGKEVVSFVISVGSVNEENEDRSQFDERWRVEKLYSDFLTLDSQVMKNNNIFF